MFLRNIKVFFENIKVFFAAWECVKTKPCYPIVSCRGEVHSPENSLLCVFGQANPAPTADDGMGRFSFDTLSCCKKTLMFPKKIERFSKKMVMFLKNITIFFKKPGMFLCKGRWNHPHQVGHSFFSVHSYILSKTCG